ncbi:hypothetical protein M409DRAFT_26797 [Zasmidium cellare ATCC 36951]|uniref:Life-span regulatory factor domain-containing protein n=1 Tax=Zasmidium cellare ATCC 36951 TaxID=1080233 RepID=A0A6A6C742_ZASCE|nr:uncharacterized protein M409DRAFT_26797 [Zasmidium cellare ATCC 36951]KAF2162944.1 hypothetical protein M409DRAFT_26797 [Zasmidium cellare ATCC 36951]
MPDRPQHARTQSQGRKLLPPHARPSKAPPLRRGTSYNHAHPQSHGQHHHSHSKSGSGWSKKVGGAAEEDAQHIEEEESGMASFLQFCATCEKQIFTPGASILYCSEACRRKDVSRPPSIQSIEAVRSPSIVSQSTSYFDHHDILPQRSPTVLRPVSLAMSDLSLSDSNSLAEETIDTTEPGHNDSSRYLEQFYADFSSANYASGTRRPRTTRASTATDSSNIPSLVHSPSSSYGTVASNASYRPLPPRHNPFSATNCSTKSIDLVLPYDTTTNHQSPSISPTTQLLKDSSLKSSASTLTSFRVAEGNDITYDKRTPQASRRGSAKSEKKADHSLKQLFSHEAMKAPPRQ